MSGAEVYRLQFGKQDIHFLPPQTSANAKVFNRTLFVAEGFDRVEVRGFDGGVGAENDADN